MIIGLLTRTVGAKNKTKIAEAQEIANLEYAARLIDSRVNTTSASATAESIADVLDKKGFTVQDKGATISGVSLLDGTTPVTTLDLNTGDEKTLKVSTETTGDESTEWYVQIDDKWHKIEVKSNGVEIAKDGVASLGNSNASQTITIAVTGMPENPSASVKKLVEGGEDITISTNAIEVVKNDEIKITAGSSALKDVKITLSVANVTPLNVGLTVTKVVAPPTTAEFATVKTTPVVPDETFKRDYGLIDVIWINKTNNIISNPLVEVPSGLTPIKYKSNVSEITDSSQTYDTTTADATDWYDYSQQKWANAINPDDGSFFVWIPRYAYRITYYDSDPTVENSTAKITGYYDGNGMWSIDSEGNSTAHYALEDGIETVNNTENGKKYIVHPAFMKDDGKKADDGVTALPDYDRGGWSENLAGIWVAKYEMSREDYDSTSGKWIAYGTGYMGGGNFDIKKSGHTDSIRIVSKPSTETVTVSSWRQIVIANCYTNSYNYNRDMESHLIKNSEWGAVAYLTHSKYGTNGKEIYINNSSDYLTGNAGNNASSDKASGITNYYNSANGVNGSTTKNIYGIYDFSGGSGEYIAIYNNKEHVTNKWVTNKGWTGLTPESDSTKYATRYYNGSDSISNGDEIYNIGKIGDGTKEVYASKDVTISYSFGDITTKRNWFDDFSGFVSGNSPFMERGNGTGISAGVFYAGTTTGNESSNVSFRIVLSPSLTNSNS